MKEMKEYREHITFFKWYVNEEKINLNFALNCNGSLSCTHVEGNFKFVTISFKIRKSK